MFFRNQVAKQVAAEAAAAAAAASAAAAAAASPKVSIQPVHNKQHKASSSSKAAASANSHHQAAAAQAVAAAFTGKGAARLTPDFSNLTPVNVVSTQFSSFVYCSERLAECMAIFSAPPSSGSTLV